MRLGLGVCTPDPPAGIFYNECGELVARSSQPERRGQPRPLFPPEASANLARLLKRARASGAGAPVGWNDAAKDAAHQNAYRLRPASIIR
jgi:hypothetical protein